MVNVLIEIVEIFLYMLKCGTSRVVTELQHKWRYLESFVSFSIFAHRIFVAGDRYCIPTKQDESLPYAQELMLIRDSATRRNPR